MVDERVQTYTQIPKHVLPAVIMCPVRDTGKTQKLHLILDVPLWPLIEREDIKRLERAFKFESFGEALAFTNKVGEIAESEEHHPALLTERGKATVTWRTRKIRGCG